MKVKRVIKNRAVGLNLNTRTHTTIGIISFILAVISILCMTLAIYISVSFSREMLLNIYLIGTFEIIAFILSLLGIALGIAGELTVESIKRYAHLGIALNLILFLFHISIISSGY